MAFAFSCNACGQCCQGGGPALSIEEVFKYQDVFIAGLHWGAHYLDDKPVARHSTDPHSLLPTAPQKRYWETFLSSFTTSGHVRYPVIYPVVTGYTLADGEPCSSLTPDGACSLHADKPQMCRAVPFDAMLPEEAQHFVLAGFQRFGCMTQTTDAEAENAIFSDGRIRDAVYKMDYDTRVKALQSDSRDHLNRLVELLGNNDCPGKFGLPSTDYFLRVTESGGWMETSMMPLLIDLGATASFSERVPVFIAAQQRLIQAALEMSVHRRIKAHRKRTEWMRRYLREYDAVLSTLSEIRSLVPARS